MTSVLTKPAARAGGTPRAEGFTQPPVSPWGITWRSFIAIGGGIIPFFMVALTLPVDRLWLMGLDVVTGIIVIVLMYFRRRWPLVIALISVVLGSVSGMAAGALSITIVSLATRRRWREVIPVGILFVAAGWFYSWLVDSDAMPLVFQIDSEMTGSPNDLAASGAAPGPWWLTGVMTALTCAILMAIGFYIGARRELIASLQQRLDTAEREQSARENQARTAERSDIAREMHDVLAHRISLVAMHSGALTYRKDLSRDETAATAEIIRDNAHLALTELREVLGVLRDDTRAEARPDQPQPTLANLNDLIDQTASSSPGAQLRVAPEIADHLTELSSTTGRTAYRILQEALTNVRKHAPGTSPQILLSGAPGQTLTLEVRNPVPQGDVDPRLTMPSSGMGLTGLTERAALAGGELTHGVDRGGDFVVRAWLPWQI